MVRNGKNIDCNQCGKTTYKPLGELKRSKNHFCGSVCANEFQGRNKIELECKVCSSSFRVSKSEVEKSLKRGHTVQYCSMNCRNNDTERMTEKAQIMNQIQLEKQGLNKLEKAGRYWLQSLGFILNVDFFEQVLLFDKFCVDVYFPKFNLVVQFDGEYWHKQPKRKKTRHFTGCIFAKGGFEGFQDY